MTARAIVLVPLVLVLSSLPGCLFLRRMRWHPLEKIVAAIGLSLLVIAILAFVVYLSGAPVAGYYVVAAALTACAAGAVPEAVRLMRARHVGTTVAAFGALVLWTIGLQALIRHYSGGDWCCDWVEHYQRTVFFLERWPMDFRFIDRYPLTTRPPLMNLVTAFFLAMVGKDFALFQMTFTMLNLLAFFPCCLFARRFAPRAVASPAVIAIFLAFNPMFFMNTTFAWTKVLSAFFVLGSVWFYIRGTRKGDLTRVSVAFAGIAAALLVHYSALPYALFLGLAYLSTAWLAEKRRLRALAVAVGPAIALGAAWLGWELAVYGAGTTFGANATVEGTAGTTVMDNVIRISSNAFHTFRPYVFPGQPGDTPLRLLIDRAFTFYQENLLGAIGLVNAYVVIVTLVSALVLRRARFTDRERWFWMAFVSFTLVVGIAIDGETSPSGLANICLQPLVYLAVTLVASSYRTFARPVRMIVWCGVLIDFVFGVALEVYMESQMRAWARTPNWDWKEREQLVFLGDVLRQSAGAIEGVMVTAAITALGYLAWIAWAAPAGPRGHRSALSATLG